MKQKLVTLYRNPTITLVITLLLIGYQLARLVIFINVYGGLEHDGGWMISVSRSLAEKGTYTSMVGTIADPSVPGAVNVDEKFNIQAPDGSIWFFTGNGTGPASIIPDALILKIFGTSFWALRAGPLLFYLLFLILSAYILYRLAGLGAIILFHSFLFFYPHISIFLGYEAMGEVPSMVYILGAYVAFAAVIVSKRSYKSWLGVGIIIGLALEAKLITLWSISGIFIWIVLVWFFKQEQSSEVKSVRWKHLGGLSLGTALPILAWELIHWIVLTRLTNFDLYLRHTQQRIRFILDDGSGIGLQIHSGPEFFWDKFFLLTEIAHPARWVTGIIFLALFFGGLGLIWWWRQQPYRQTLVAIIWLGWLMNTLWFVSLAKTGWPRHFWFGLVLAMILLSVIPIVFISWEKQQDSTPFSARMIRGVGIVLLMIIGWNFSQQPHVRSLFLSDDIVSYWRQKQITNKYHASLPWIIIPRADQKEVVDYIQQMPPEANVYFPGMHKSAEIPPQTGRLNYTLERREYSSSHPDDVVLIGPSIISPWQDEVRRQDLLRLVEQECPHPAVKNEFYRICPIKDNAPQ